MKRLKHMPGDERFKRIYGAFLGLAFGDAISFAALFHRTHQFPERRREFIWRTNRDLMRQRIIHLTLPFTHRLAPEILEPFPTDDTEYAIFTAQTLLSTSSPTAATFLAAWRDRVLPVADLVLTGFSERAAIENIKRGLTPPMSGNDNPQHYNDSAVARAVAVGAYYSGDAESAAQVAALEAQVTNAEDGIYAAQAMAAAIALISSGHDLIESLKIARTFFPKNSWIANGNGISLECLQEAESAQDLLLLLTTRLINTVYSYGNVAPETVPAAFAIVEVCRGDLQQAVMLANAIPKSADSLPAMVGALCGAYQGADVISAKWKSQLNECRGLCLPFVKGACLDEVAKQIADRK